MPSTAAVTWVADSLAGVFRDILQVMAVALIRLPGSFQDFGTSFRYLDFGGRPSPLLLLQIRSRQSDPLVVRLSASVHLCRPSRDRHFSIPVSVTPFVQVLASVSERRCFAIHSFDSEAAFHSLG